MGKVDAHAGHPPSPTESSRSIRRNAGMIGLAALFVVVALVNVLWLAIDDLEMQQGDNYRHLTTTFRFYDKSPLRLFTEPLTSLDELSFGGRPPLYHLLTIPFLAILGRTGDTACYVNLLFLAVLLASTYQTARLVSGQCAGLLAAIFVACYPPILHLSRTYLPHSAVPACVALSVCLLVSLLVNRSVRTAWLFGLSLACGALVHPSFLPLPVIPTVAAGIYLVFFSAEPKQPPSLGETPRWVVRKLRDRFVVVGLLPAAGVALVAASAWYLTIGWHLMSVQGDLMGESLVAFRGFKYVVRGFPDVEPGFWWFARTAPGAITNVLSLTVVLAVVLAIVKRNALALFLAFWLAVDYVLLGVNTVFHWWSGAAILPIAAALSGIFLADLRPRWLASACTVLCVAVAAFAFVVSTWGATPRVWQYAVALGAEEERCWDAKIAFCPLQAGTEIGGWPVKEIAKTLVTDSRLEGGRARTLLLDEMKGSGKWRCWGAQPCQGRRRTGLWPALFAYLLTRDYPLSKFEVFASGSPVWGQPFKFRFVRSDYVLYPLREFTATGVGLGSEDVYRTATRAFLQEPPREFVASHKRMATFNGPKDTTAVLLKRTAPLTAIELEASIAATELTEKQKSLGYELLESMRASSLPEEQPLDWPSSDR